MSSESSRFQHLLQPIRDLSKNWNIDLAQELEEYLDELEHLSIAFDQDGAPTAASSKSFQLMNFAEAALLIQGTSMIYSRKVEYLYALVFQTLAHLSKQQGGAGGDGDAYGDDDDSDDDDDVAGGEGDDDGGDGNHKKKKRKRQALDVFANPLPLYDELEEARNITLRKPVAQAQNSSAGRRPGQRHDLTKTKNNIQASIALMSSLVPDERDHGETFKLLSCHLHPSGVLLLDEASKKYLQDESEPLGFSQVASPRLQHTPMAKLNFDPLDTSTSSDRYGNNNQDHDHDDEDDNEPMEDAGYDYGGGDDGADDDHNELTEQRDVDGMEDIFAAPIKPEPFVHDDMAEGGTTSTTPKLVRTATRMVTVPDVKDPWAPLDAYDATKSTVRPFRKGRSYPVRGAKKLLANKTKKAQGMDEDEMDGVDDPAFKERFLRSANRPQWSTWVWNDLDDRALETKFKKKYCNAPCLMTTCDALWRLETKWKSMMRKCVASEEQSANAILLQEQAEEEEDEQMHAMTANSKGLGMNDAFLTNPEVHEVDGVDDDDDDDGDMDNGVDYEGGDDDWGQNASGYSLLENSVALKSNGFGQPMVEQDGERALSYEEICRQHLEEFMKGTEKYMRETDLTRQINDWQEKLSPILREQDAHPPFDIHKYGRDILDHLKTSSGTTKTKNNSKRRKRKDEYEDLDDARVEDVEAVPFGEVVGGLNQYEVCRMFLASLQLANNGNVQLHHAKTAADQASVPFEMQLLTTSNVYESLQHEAVTA